MDLRIFISILFVLSLSFYFIPVKNVKNQDIKEDKALVVFENPDMYTLTTQKVTRRIQASQVVRYKNRDEIFDANIMLNNEKDIERLLAKKVKNENDILNLQNSVYYQKGKYLALHTNELIYNTANKAIYNTTTFNAKYNGNRFLGEDLYLDSKTDEIKANNVKFSFDIENKEKGL